MHGYLNQGKEIQQRKGSHRRNNSKETKGSEGAEDGMSPIGMQPPKQQQRKAFLANQMEKQRLKSNLRITMI